MFIYFAVLCLFCWAGFSLVAACELPVMVPRLLFLWSTGSRALGLQKFGHMRSAVAAPRL